MNRVFFKVKVCKKEEHRDAFLEGNLHMNPLGYFRKLEEKQVGNVADKHEATIALLQPGQFTLVLTGDGLPDGRYELPSEDLAEPSVIQCEEHDFLNVLCLYAVHDRGATFESDQAFERFVNAQMMVPDVGGLGEYAAFVVDSKAFQDRVLEGMRKKGIGSFAGLVDYYDPSTFNGWFSPFEAVVKKRTEFAHQREYRFALDRGTHEATSLTLPIGSLRDIAIGCRTSEVNDLIRDYLYQLKAQGVFDQASN